MPFHYLYDLATGRLLTEVLDDDVLPDPLPDGVGVVTRATRWIALRVDGVGWDEATRDFVVMEVTPQ